jgi:putative transposase
VSNDNVSKLIQPGCVDDQLTEILRQGARTVPAQAVDAEVADFLAKHTGLKTEDAANALCARPSARAVMTGVGPVAVPPAACA